ncbi:rhodanese-like domain-containing protein [uncultured Desulfovibrio sp.]|uniref:rhodanese-like domain-containing protein n=1 Tax=uncultured Desulfovibrio sp. TaxID=167968 RepID=UPI00262DD70C|nr:rhodanese-like domain-containing protein [uncultured Desulfovibrio sp.]
MDFFGGRFDLDAAALPKDQLVLLYCRTGQRSAAAAEALEQIGVKNILHMNQGIEPWEKVGLPLQK